MADFGDDYRKNAFRNSTPIISGSNADSVTPQPEAGVPEKELFELTQTLNSAIDNVPALKMVFRDTRLKVGAIVPCQSTPDLLTSLTSKYDEEKEELVKSGKADPYGLLFLVESGGLVKGVMFEINEKGVPRPSDGKLEPAMLEASRVATIDKNDLVATPMGPAFITSSTEKDFEFLLKNAGIDPEKVRRVAFLDREKRV